MNKRVYRHIHIISISIVLLSLENGVIADNRDALKLNINIEKDLFLIDEPIYLEMVETNISDSEVEVTPMRPDWSLGNFKIILTNDRGEEFNFKGGEAFVKGNFVFILHPEDSLVYVKDLLTVFGKWGDPAHQFSLYLPLGRYKVQVVHHTNIKAFVGPNRQREDKQTVYSNILEFEVVEPQGFERQAHQRLMEIITQYNAAAPETRQIRREFHEFINSYPNSVYRPLAYRFLLTIYQLHGLKGRGAAIREALVELSHSRFSYELLNSFMHDILIDFINRSGYDKAGLLDKLDIQNVESKAAYYAKCYVDEVKIGRRAAERMKSR